MSRLYFYPCTLFERDVKKIVRMLWPIKDRFDSVCGIKRGGLILAVYLAYALNIKLVFKPQGERTLIVDDIADKGKRLRYLAKKGYFIVTLFYHPHGKVRPNIWLREKRGKYIIFPWAKNDVPKAGDRKYDCAICEAAFRRRKRWGGRVG